MPPLIIDYSGNRERRVDMAGLRETQRAAAAER